MLVFLVGVQTMFAATCDDGVVTLDFFGGILLSRLQVCSAIIFDSILAPQPKAVFQAAQVSRS